MSDGRRSDGGAGPRARSRSTAALRPLAAGTAALARRGRAAAPRRLTRRGLILLLIAFALTAMSIYPLRQYVTQQQRIEQVQAKQAALDTEVARLEAERERLQDPEYVEQLAREELQMAKPGEETYVMTGPQPADRPADAQEGNRSKRPWYKRLWDALVGRAE